MTLNWHDFLRDYSFDDSQEVYTNGSRLIPVFRVEQLIKHLLKAHEPIAPEPTTDNDWVCGNCAESLVGYSELDAGGFVTYRYCAPELWHDEEYIKAKIMKQHTVDAIPVEWMRDKMRGYASSLKSTETAALVMVMQMWQKEQDGV